MYRVVCHVLQHNGHTTTVSFPLYECPRRSLTSTGFEQRTEIANWINVAAFVAVMFLLISYAVLPVKWTHRHYLSICLVIGVVCMEVCADETHRDLD